MYSRRFSLRAILISVFVIVLVFSAAFLFIFKTDGKSTGVASLNASSATHKTTSTVKMLSLSARVSLATNPSVYDSVKVINGQGIHQILDVRKTPLFFFSYWGSSTALSQLADDWTQFKRPPVLISTGWPTGTLISSAQAQTEELIKSVQLTQAKVYYLSGNPFGTYVEGVPDTYVWQNGHVYHVPGTLPNAAGWINVFNGELQTSK